MIIVLSGPTASGKTSLSIRLAHALGGPDAVEIISADAMQLYRGMNIGTAKITEAEMEGIRHHQLDVLDISEEASVQAYQRHGRADIAAILRAGKTPLIVGGSGLYISALINRLEFPPRDYELRWSLEEIYQARGLAPLLEELRERDREAWEVVDHANPRRVIRALEVVRLTGKPYKASLPRAEHFYADVRYLAVGCPKDLLHQRIAKRTEAMFASGFVEEVRALLGRGLAQAPTASRATGYAQVRAYLAGAMSLEQAQEATMVATRQLAKKQRTWIRGVREVREITPDIDAASLAADLHEGMYQGEPQ